MGLGARINNMYDDSNNTVALYTILINSFIESCYSFLLNVKIPFLIKSAAPYRLKGIRRMLVLFLFFSLRFDFTVAIWCSKQWQNTKLRCNYFIVRVYTLLPRAISGKTAVVDDYIRLMYSNDRKMCICCRIIPCLSSDLYTRPQF